MKKFLLSAAVLGCTMMASGQNYIATGYTEEDEDWTPSYDQAITVNDPITVEVYNDHVVLRSWLGAGSNDLEVAFDEDENVTSVTPITKGVSGSPVTSGYCAFNTGSSDYYYVQLYIADGYNYAYADNTEGYVTVSGYFYKSETEYVWAYYNIVWEAPADPILTTSARAEIYEDADASLFCFQPAGIIGVDVYNGSVMLKGWAGKSGYDVKLAFNEDAQVIDMTSYVANEESEEVPAGVEMGLSTGNSEYYFMEVSTDDCFAYATAEGGYVYLQGKFYSSATEYKEGYIYIPFDTTPVEAAPLYITGDFSENSWNATEPNVFEWTGSEYTFTVTCNMFKISSSCGDWDTFNENALCLGANPEDEGTYNLISGDANILVPWMGEWTIVVSSDLSTITLSTTTEKPGPGNIEVYLRGGMNDWGTDDAWKFSTTDGVVYTLKGVTIEEGVEFKIADANWALVNYGSSVPVMLDEEVVLDYNGGNITVDYEGEDVGAVDLTFNLKEATLYMTIAGEGSDVKGDANGDGLVDATDISYMIAYMLGEATTGFNIDNADIDGDGIIDATDIAKVIAIMLGE